MRLHPLPITAFALAGALGFSGLALAQGTAEPPAPPPHAMPAPAAPMHGPGMGMGPGMGAGPAMRTGPAMMGHQWGGPHRWMGEEGARRGAFMRHMKTWSLFGHHGDLALSPSDVQTIAEAILLRHGEHAWKVGDVTPNADHTVSFAFVTEHGDVIARFTMDTMTGRITRAD